MATRRDIATYIAAGLGVVACSHGLAQPAENAAYVAIETFGTTNLSQARFFSASGAPVSRTSLDHRAHGLAQDRDRLVVFPRRPGNRFSVLSLRDLQIRQVITALPDRHFYGHGAFTHDGRLLLVTQNNLETLQGEIGIYETQPPWRRVAAVPLPGPGPHDILRDPGRDRFFIALGGLETHPDYGRLILNLSTFQSRLLSLDIADLKPIDLDVFPGAQGISFRHLAQDMLGDIYVGGQVPRGAKATGPVLWVVGPDGAEPIDTGALLGGYVSSIAASGDQIIVTSKATGAVLTFKDRRILRQDRIEGASAIGLSGSIRAMSGFHKLFLGDEIVRVSEMAEFDNHGLALSL